MIAASREHHLPAAVIDSRLHDAATVAAAARVVPDDAKRLTVGGAQLGYRRKASRGGGFVLASRRLHEVERIIMLRHGGPVDTDDAESYFDVVLHCLLPRELQRAAGRPDPVGLVIAGVATWCSRWLPGLPRYEITLAIEAAIAEPKFFRADTAARMLRLRMSERLAADVTTIGAIDADAGERARLSKERQAARSKARRAEARAAGEVKPRAEYEAGSVAAECRRLGISRAAFYKRRKRAAEVAAEAALHEPKAEVKAPVCTSLLSKKVSGASLRVANGTCKPQVAAPASIAATVTKVIPRDGGASRRRAARTDRDHRPPEGAQVTDSRTKAAFPPRTKVPYKSKTVAAREIINKHLVRSGRPPIPDEVSDRTFAVALDAMELATVAVLGGMWSYKGSPITDRYDPGSALERFETNGFLNSIALILKQADSDARRAKQPPRSVFPPAAPVTGEGASPTVTSTEGAE